jgi:hypothetical protein
MKASIHHICFETYPLLGQLTRTLVLAVSEEFDNTTLVWCKSIPSLAHWFLQLPLSRSNIPRDLLDNLPDERSLLAQVTLGPADSGLDNSCLGFLHIAWNN